MATSLILKQKCVIMEVAAIEERNIQPDPCSTTACQEDYLTIEDDHEDACTQTDGHTLCKAVPDVDGPDMEVPFECQDGKKMSSVPPVFTIHDCDVASQALLHKRRGNYYLDKEKTCNSFKTMKEKHRENERLRHHSLNQHLKNICRNVPGSAEDGKETKVVMMQRIISYMSYLENTIETLCLQFGLKPNSRWTMLSSSLTDIEEAGTWEKEFSASHSEDSEDSIVLPSTSLHLKLSSPTIDSTTDPATNDSVSSVVPPPSETCSPGLETTMEVEEAVVPSSPIVEELEEQPIGKWYSPAEKTAVHESGQFAPRISPHKIS